MVSDDGGNKWKKVIFIIIGILATLMVLIGLFTGLTSLRKFFIWLLAGLLILAILFGIAYTIYLIFLKKNFVDIPATFKKKLIHTANLMKNEMLGNLYLSGDSKHNRIKLGRFAYMRMKLPKQTTEMIETKQKGEFGEFVKPTELQVTSPVNIDCFIIVKDKMIDKLFGDPIFILCKPDDHDHSTIFNDVTLNGFNLVPLDGQFYTLDTRNLDTDIIKGMSIIYQKEVVDEIFKNLDRLVKMSMNLDTEHQKQKEKNLQFDIPQINTGENK